MVDMVEVKAKKGKRLDEGDIIELGTDDRVYALVPQSVKIPTSPVDWSLVRSEISIGQYGYLSGRYIAYKTVNEQHSPTDFGWHVYCENVKYPYIKVDFYQEGSHMDIGYKKVVAKAERRWVVGGEHDSGGTRIDGRDV